jgi:hypothetical protein
MKHMIRFRKHQLSTADAPRPGTASRQARTICWGSFHSEVSFTMIRYDSITVDGVRGIAGAGDANCFASDHTHRLGNVGSKPARLVISCARLGSESAATRKSSTQA